MSLFQNMQVSGAFGSTRNSTKNSSDSDCTKRRNLKEPLWIFFSVFRLSRISTVLIIFLSICSQSVFSQWVELQAQQGQGYPTVMKCCPLHQRYEKGRCVVSEQQMGGERWSPPSSMNMKYYSRENATEVTENPVVFLLRFGQPKCSTGYMEKIILKETPTKVKGSGSEDDDRQQWIPESDIIDADQLQQQPDVVLSTEGYLLWRDDHNFMNTYQHENFCIDQVNKTAFIAVVCKPACTEERPCIRKCCMPDSILDHRSRTCGPAHPQWKPYLYNSTLDKVSQPDDYKPHYIVGIPGCQDAYTLSMRDDPEDKFYVTLNGSLATLYGDTKYFLPPESFCVDGSVDESQSDYRQLDFFHYSGLELDQVAVICHKDDKEEEKRDWFFIVLASFMLFSSFFLILTAIVYLILWEYQNIHGWLQFAYVLSLLFAFTLLPIVQLFPHYFHKTESINICKFAGSVIHFSFLSAFFWLSSMNLDLFLTFSGNRGGVRASSRTGEKKRFALFGLLSWGGAISIASTGIALDVAYKDNDAVSYYLPQFGTNRCYFHNEWSKLPFFYAPVGFLLCVNLVFFLSTIYSLHELQKDTKFATRQSSKQDKKRFVLFMKLFIVMGVIWIFEVISWLCMIIFPSEHDTLKLVFLFTDILNALQGFFIFLIFTCKPNTCKQLEGQFKRFSIHLEEKRDKTIGNSTSEKVSSFFWIGLCTLVLPLVHGVRKAFSFCGRPTRKLGGRRHTSHHTTVTSVFEKSRKASEGSAVTTLSIADAYEMNQTY